MGGSYLLFFDLGGLGGLRLDEETLGDGVGLGLVDLFVPVSLPVVAAHDLPVAADQVDAVVALGVEVLAQVDTDRQAVGAEVGPDQASEACQRVAAVGAGATVAQLLGGLEEGLDGGAAPVPVPVPVNPTGSSTTAAPATGTPATEPLLSPPGS